MSDEEIIITNTYLNSKNKFLVAHNPNNHAVRNKNKSNVSWKKDMIIEHVYCPNSVIHEKVEKI